MMMLYSRMTEHSIPKEINAEWHKQQQIKCDPKDVEEFGRKYREKELIEKRRQQT